MVLSVHVFFGMMWFGHKKNESFPYKFVDSWMKSGYVYG